MDKRTLFVFIATLVFYFAAIKIYDVYTTNPNIQEEVIYVSSIDSLQ